MRLAEKIFSLPPEQMREVCTERGKFELLRDGKPVSETHYCQIFKAPTLSILFDMIEDVLTSEQEGGCADGSNQTFLTPLTKQQRTNKIILYYYCRDLHHNRMLRYDGVDGMWLADIAVIYV